MEYLMAGEFWREVGLTVAARLSVVAVALWAVKMVTDHWQRSVAAQSVLAGAQPVRTRSASRITNPPITEHPDKQQSAGAVRRRLVLPKTESDAWRKKMGKYLSVEPVVTSTSPRRQK